MTLGNQRVMVIKSMINGCFEVLKTCLQKEVADLENLTKDPKVSFLAYEKGSPLCVYLGKVLPEKEEGMFTKLHQV